MSFYTDVISPDPRFNSVARVSDLSLLEPVTRQLVQGIVAAAKQMGIEIMAFETYRSQARQQQLFTQGATKLQTVGVHHYGLACDIVRVAAGDPSWKGDFAFLGQLAHSSGLIWGGDWAHPLFTIILWITCTSSVAPLPGRGTFFPAHGIQTTPITPTTRTNNTPCLLPRPSLDGRE